MKLSAFAVHLALGIVGEIIAHKLLVSPAVITKSLAPIVIAVGTNLCLHLAKPIDGFSLLMVGLPEPLLSGPSYNLLAIPTRLELLEHPID